MIRILNSKLVRFFAIYAVLFAFNSPDLLFLSEGNSLFAKQAQTKKSSSKAKTLKRTPAKKSPKKAPVKKSNRSRKAKTPALPSFSLIKDTTLAPGIIYKQIILGRGRARHSVHLIEADLDSNIAVKTFKGKQHAFGLEKLSSMANSYDSLNDGKVIAAINANFWRAYKNFPIGPTITNGEVVEMNAYKEWSAGLFDKAGKLYIDNFKLSGHLILRDGREIRLETVNRRRDSTGFVLYNRFGGDVIPFVQPKVIEAALAEALQETFFADSTEDEFDISAFVEEQQNSERSANLEFNIPKITLKYLVPPAVNRGIVCVVESVRQGAVVVPENGCVLSVGINAHSELLPRAGDTVVLEYRTNVHSNIEFIEGVSGTPRLVRNGRAKHEAYEEGSRGRRFINRGLARTAIGTDKKREKIYLATIEPNNRRTTGATLQQLAELMSRLGAYNAMNLDGGGSSAMVIEGRNILYPGNPFGGRRISVGLGIIQTLR